MKLTISNTKQLGMIVRATRNAFKVRADDIASMANLGPVFVRDVEYGKETVELGRVLRLLNELGIQLVAEFPDSARQGLDEIMAKGGLVRPSLRKRDSESLVTKLIRNKN